MKLTTNKQLTDLVRARMEEALEGEKVVLCMGDRLTLAAFAHIPVIEPHLACACTTTAEAEEAIRDTYSTFVISDDVPEAGSGVELLRAHRHLKTVLLSSRANDGMVREAESAGVDALIFRQHIGNDGSGAFLQALSRVASGGVYIPPAVAAHAGEADPTALELVASLTATERKVLSLVSKGLDNQQISEELVVSESTTKTHLKSLRSRLGPEYQDRVKLCLLGIRSGI